MVTLSSPPTPCWITLNQAAEYLNVVPKSVRRYIADGQLPAYRLAGRQTIRIKVEDLDALLRPIPTAGGAR